MIYIVIFFYGSAAGFLALKPYNNLHDACRQYVYSESTPKAVFELDTKAMRIRQITCEQENFTDGN